jgi:ParB family chromosome partitioning protein
MGTTALNISRIKGDPNNVRTKVSVKDIEWLAQSIKEIGLQQPIVLRPHEGDYMVIAGHRRLAAIGLLVDAGDHSAELVIDQEVILRAEGLTEADVTVAQLVENLQREDIDVLDEAAGYMRLLEFDMSQADIARKVGRSRAHVTKRLALVALPVKAKDALTSGKITIEHALAIAALDTEAQADYCEGRVDDAFALQRLIRKQKGTKEAAKLAATLEGLGLRRVDDLNTEECPEGFHYETAEYVFADQFDGQVPEGGVIFTVEANGEQASARIYQVVENTTGKTADKETKRAEQEKAKAKEERLLKQKRISFLTASLAKVKAADAQDMALNMTLDRVGFANAREICVLLDLEVPSKEEKSYDGKVRNVKQYYPLLQALIKEARTDGDIGFLRRVVLAVSACYGYESHLLEHFGFDPNADEDDG